MQKTSAVHTIREELLSVVCFLAVIWVTFFLDWLLPLSETFSLVPRSLMGLTGVVAMPFLHGGLGHIWGNTIPLFVLLVLLAGSRAKSWEIVFQITVLGGLLLWVFGRESRHIGASLLVFGLITFLISSGLFEKRIVSLAIAGLVGFMYGFTLLWGIIPKLGNSRVSWDGHLCGGIAGVMVAYVLTRFSQSRATEKGSSTAH